MAHVTDGNNELYYLNARYHNPVWGRFISEDPAGIAPGNVASSTPGLVGASQQLLAFLKQNGSMFIVNK